MHLDPSRPFLPGGPCTWPLTRPNIAVTDASCRISLGFPYDHSENRARPWRVVARTLPWRDGGNREQERALRNPRSPATPVRQVPHPWLARPRDQTNGPSFPVTPRSLAPSPGARRSALEASAACACVDVCDSGGRCIGRRLRSASRRDHALPLAGASPRVRERRDLLGVFLWSPFVAHTGSDRRATGAVRSRRGDPACLVCRRGQAGILRGFAGDIGRHVFLLAA